MNVIIEANRSPEELSKLELELLNRLGETSLETEIEKMVSAYVYELEDETVLLEKPKVVLLLE